MSNCDERATSIEDIAKSESEYLPDWYDKETFIKGFQEGAKYMKNRMYSEEEILEQLNYLMKLPSSEFDKFTDDSGNITKKWFKTYKKKNE